MAKRVKSEAEKEYQKERRRLLQAVRRGEQKGYIYPEDIVPPLPKHVTRRQLEHIKATKPSDLYKVAQWVDTTTGELISGKEKQKREAKAKQQLKETSARINKAKAKIRTPHISKGKQVLSAEEKHKRAVERGKKAWKTRRSKMSDAEYQQYVETFKTRMKTAREKKRQPDTDYPTFSAVDTVHEKLEELDRFYSPYVEEFANTLNDLKRESAPWYHITVRKGHLIDIFDDTISMYEDNMSELENYLVYNMDTISYHLNIIRYDSKEENLSNSFSELGVILNHGSLNPSQAEGLSLMAEYYESYEED